MWKASKKKRVQDFPHKRLLSPLGKFCAKLNCQCFSFDCHIWLWDEPRPIFCFHLNYSLKRICKDIKKNVHIAHMVECTVVVVRGWGGRYHYLSGRCPTSSRRFFPKPSLVSREVTLSGRFTVGGGIAAQRTTVRCLPPRSSERKMDGSSWTQTGASHPSRP